MAEHKSRRAIIMIALEVDEPSLNFVRYVKDMGEHLPSEAAHWAEEGRRDTNRSPIEGLRIQRRVILCKEGELI